MPLTVETTEGETVAKDAYETQEEAEASAKERNTRAEKLGIKTRYRVRT